MPEYVIGMLFSAALGLAGFTAGRLGNLDKRLDELSVKAAETYVTKEDLGRIEDKLDAVIWSRDKMIVSPGTCDPHTNKLDNPFNRL